MPTAEDRAQRRLIKILRVEPGLTANQLAAVDNQPMRKSELKDFFPKKNRPPFQKTYQRTLKTLNRMLGGIDEKTGRKMPVIVEQGRDAVIGEAFLWWLKESGFEWHKGDDKRDHENACRRLFVAYHPHFIWWDTGWTAYEKTEYRIEQWEFEYDRRMVLPASFFSRLKRDAPMIWEVDGANEAILDDGRRDSYSDLRWRKSINGKIDKYLRFFKANPGIWAYVLFATFEGRHGSKYGKPNKRANDIARLLMERGLTRGQFLVTTVDMAAVDPLGRIWLKPTESGEPERISLSDV